MQQTWEWQQPSYAPSVPPAPLPPHAWDAWQSDGQGDQTHSGESFAQHNVIYPSGSYVSSNACHNSASQLASCYISNSTPGTKQDAWHTDYNGTGPYSATAYPEQASHLPSTVISSEGCSQPAAVYANFTYQTAYQQEAWHHLQGAPEQNLYYAGAVAGANVIQTAGYASADHTYLDQLEQQRQIEHAQYLISRWGTSDETPAEASPLSWGLSTLPAAAPYTATQSAPNQVDQYWTPGTMTEGGVQNAWSSSAHGVQQQCRWPHPAQSPREATQRISSGTCTQTTSGRGHSTQRQAPGQQQPEQSQAGECRRRAHRWSPKEFLSDDKNLLNTPTSSAISKEQEREKIQKGEFVIQEDFASQQKTTISSQIIKIDIQHNQQKTIFDEDDKEFQSQLLQLNKTQDNNNNHNWVFQRKSQASMPSVQQMNLPCTHKCIINYDTNGTSLKNNMKNDKLQHSSLEDDTFERSTQNSIASFQSATMSLCEDTKLDTPPIDSKDTIYMHKFINQVATTKSIQDGNKEHRNLVTLNDFEDEMHTSSDEETRHYMQLNTNDHEEQMLNTTFCDMCSKNDCIKDKRKKHIQNTNLLLCNCKIGHAKSMMEAKDDNIQQIITQVNVENLISTDSKESKCSKSWDCQNHEYWNKTKISNQEFKSWNFNNIDFYNENYIKCNEMDRNGNLNDKIQNTIQDSNHETYASIIEDDQVKDIIERNYNEKISNLNEITNNIIGREEQLIEFEYSRDNKIMISTSAENVTNLICEFGSIDCQERKNNMLENFHNYKLIKNENNILYEKINEHENMKKSSNTTNMGEEKFAYGDKELQNANELLNYEVISYCSTSPTLTAGSCGYPQVHYKQQNIDWLNLEENLAFGLCEETPSLQEMMETTSKSTNNKKDFFVEIPTCEVELKRGSDLEHNNNNNEMDLQSNMHGQRLIYECTQNFIPSPLKVEENHGFQPDLEDETIKEMLNTNFHSASDEFVFGDGQNKGSLGYGSEGSLPPKILQQDLQEEEEDIIQQLDVDESQLFAESLEDHRSKEMQESPIRSKGQDFLDEILTCGGDSNEENAATTTLLLDHLNVYDACFKDLKLHEKRKNSSIQQNINFIIDPDYEVYSTLNTNTYIDVPVERKRKRKIHIDEEPSLYWNSNNHDRGESFCERWSKQKTNSLFNQEIGISKPKDIVIESKNKRAQLGKIASERYPSEESQLCRENYVGRNDLGVQWKLGNDFTNSLANSLENIMVGLTYEKSPKSHTKSNNIENNYKTERLLNNTEHYSYKNIHEKIMKNDQRPFFSSVSKCDKIDHDKMSHCIDHKKIEIQSNNSNKMFETLSKSKLYSKNIKCVELTEPSSGWVYHTSYRTISTIYTLDQLQKGLETSFLPEDLPIYRVQEGMYTGPFMLKNLIKKHTSLSACLIDQLQQPMIRGQNLDYIQSIENFLTIHKLDTTPFSYEPIPMVTSAWPNSISKSTKIEQNPPHFKLESPYPIAKLNNHYKLNSNDAFLRFSNRPPQTYQQSREWLDRDVFGSTNAPIRQSSLVDNLGIRPSCMYLSGYIEQPLMNFEKIRFQNLHQIHDKKYKKIEINRNIKQQSTTFQAGCGWNFCGNMKELIVV